MIFLKILIDSVVILDFGYIVKRGIEISPMLYGVDVNVQECCHTGPGERRASYGDTAYFAAYRSELRQAHQARVHSLIETVPTKFLPIGYEEVAGDSESAEKETNDSGHLAELFDKTCDLQDRVNTRIAQQRADFLKEVPVGSAGPIEPEW
jgi:hypothetical protein